MICTTCKHHNSNHCPSKEDMVSCDAYDIQGCVYYQKKEIDMNEQLSNPFRKILNNIWQGQEMINKATKKDYVEPEVEDILIEQGIDPKKEE